MNVAVVWEKDVGPAGRQAMARIDFVPNLQGMALKFGLLFPFCCCCSAIFILKTEKRRKFSHSLVLSLTVFFSGGGWDRSVLGCKGFISVSHVVQFPLTPFPTAFPCTFTENY